MARVLASRSVRIGHEPVTTNPARISADTSVSQASGDLLAKTITSRPPSRRAAWNLRECTRHAVLVVPPGGRAVAAEAGGVVDELAVAGSRVPLRAERRLGTPRPSPATARAGRAAARRGRSPSGPSTGWRRSRAGRCRSGRSGRYPPRQRATRRRTAAARRERGRRSWQRAHGHRPPRSTPPPGLKPPAGVRERALDSAKVPHHRQREAGERHGRSCSASYCPCGQRRYPAIGHTADRRRQHRDHCLAPRCRPIGQRRAQTPYLLHERAQHQELAVRERACATPRNHSRLSQRPAMRRRSPLLASARPVGRTGSPHTAGPNSAGSTLCSLPLRRRRQPVLLAVRSIDHHGRHDLAETPGATVEAQVLHRRDGAAERALGRPSGSSCRRPAACRARAAARPLPSPGGTSASTPNATPAPSASSRQRQPHALRAFPGQPAGLEQRDRRAAPLAADSARPEVRDGRRRHPARVAAGPSDRPRRTPRSAT